MKPDLLAGGRWINHDFKKPQNQTVNKNIKIAGNNMSLPPHYPVQSSTCMIDYRPLSCLCCGPMWVTLSSWPKWRHTIHVHVTCLHGHAWWIPASGRIYLPVLTRTATPPPQIFFITHLADIAELFLHANLLKQNQGTLSLFFPISWWPWVWKPKEQTRQETMESCFT